MATLHKFELSWKRIVWEAILVWLPALAVWLAWRYPPFQFLEDWLTKPKANFWVQLATPLPASEGWGTLSFVSTVTGLNLVIVKLQSFLKSQEDAQARWVTEGGRRAFEKRPELNADEPTADGFRRAVQDRSKRYVDEINAENLEHWAMWNRWSVRVTIVGMLCLFFGYSPGGILAILMLLPALAVWLLGRSTGITLFNKIDTVCDLGADFINRLQVESGRTQSKLKKKLKEAGYRRLPLESKKQK